MICVKPGLSKEFGVVNLTGFLVTLLVWLEESVTEMYDS